MIALKINIALVRVLSLLSVFFSWHLLQVILTYLEIIQIISEAVPNSLGAYPLDILMKLLFFFFMLKRR